MKFFTHLTCYIFLIFGLTANINSQITVINPSMEDTPSDATVPQGWHACAELTTPDILPGYWGVYLEPSDGDTYAGIITRENGTYESYGQRLSAPLEKSQCYDFTIDLAHSNMYMGYNRPIKLQIYLGNSKCDLGQLIYQSDFVKNTDWKTHKVKFRPDDKYQYIILKAYIKDGTFSHKGNILIDNMSVIFKCSQV